MTSRKLIICLLASMVMRNPLLLNQERNIADEARSTELAITSRISNKREWNNCFIRFLKLQKFEVGNASEKSEKIRAK